MTGFLDRLLHADKPQPLDVDTAAAMLSTTPGLLREFERSYHANVLDRKNAPTGPLGPDAKTVVESRSGHGLSDEALALDARIVRELLSDTGVIRFDGERLTTIPALAPVPEKYVTESDVNALRPEGEAPVGGRAHPPADRYGELSAPVGHVATGHGSETVRQAAP